MLPLPQPLPWKSPNGYHWSAKCSCPALVWKSALIVAGRNTEQTAFLVSCWICSQSKERTIKEAAGERPWIFVNYCVTDFPWDMRHTHSRTRTLMPNCPRKGIDDRAKYCIKVWLGEQWVFIGVTNRTMGEGILRRVKMMQKHNYITERFTPNQPLTPGRGTP